MKVNSLFCVVVATCIPVYADANEVYKDKVASLVGTLGYGGAIHNFKNYVLRGDNHYREAAEAQFSQASQVVSTLQNASGLRTPRKEALTAIGEVVKQYQAHLPTVKRLHRQGQSVEAIDDMVAVDDSRAIGALASLREGHDWSEIQDLDFHMGYGSGIHNFKNFVLRADEQYRAQALLGLSKVLLIVARYRDSAGLSEKQIEALDEIESVVRAYEQALPKVEQLIGQGKTAKEIDAVVKVDDIPALRGLAALH